MPIGLPHVPGGASRAAAIGMLPHASSARERVWNFIRENPRCSDQQIRDGLNMNPNTVRPRRVELESAGLIRPAGEVETKTGAKAVAWIVTDKSYPSPWINETRSTMHKRRAERPTAEEMGIAVRTMREAHRLMAASFPVEAVKVMQWLAKQAGV